MNATHGLILLDKPKGLSSNAALTRAKRLLGVTKAGHTGALDPMATGMLPLCFGEATKVAGYLLGRRKAYDARIELGVTTDTDDAEGQVLQTRPVPAIDLDTLDAALARFTGRIAQRAPAYSALKQQGVPLYKRARRGETVEAPTREVEVERIDRHAFDGRAITLSITCGSGTYIRSIARDLGEALGCGAHLSALRRTWVEPFENEPMATLESIEADPGRALVPLERALAIVPRLDLDAADARRAAHGMAFRVDSAVEGLCRLHAPDGRLLALAERAADGAITIRRGFQATPSGA